MKLNDRLSEMKEKRKKVKPYDERGGARGKETEEL